MIEKYEDEATKFYNEVTDDYKKFICENSQYNPKVVKYNTNTSTYFPTITCVLSDNKDTDRCTLDYIEKYEAFYFTINIYAKNQVNDDGETVASQLIIDELSSLTSLYFERKLKMKKTLNRPTPNFDTSILRKTQQYQCLRGNARGNIIRR